MSRYAFTGNKEKEELLDLMYPIGSIYMSSNNTNPSTIFGGYWRKIESKFLFGANSSGSDLGSEGGERTHTLTIAEMPAHTHTQIVGSSGAGADALSGRNGWGGNATGSTGGSQAHNNMPPYLTVNIWERFFPAHEGETYIFDGIEVYCLLGVESTDHPLFVDKNHDLSYYFAGSDYTDESEASNIINTDNKYGYEWGGYGTETGITATGIGSGLSNTNSLIAMNLQPGTSGWYVVWDKIREFRESHSDKWFLPSKDELNLIYEVRSNLSNLSLSNRSYYLSSSELSSTDAWFQYFHNGNQSNSSKRVHFRRSRLCVQFNASDV